MNIRKRRYKFETLENRHLLTAFDLTFGTDGILTIPSSDSTWEIEPTQDGGGVALTTDNITNQMKVVRFDASGTVDTSFGANGEAFIPTIEPRGALEVLDDGSILVAPTPPTRLDFCAPNGCQTPETRPVSVIRLLPDGSLDTNFGNAGTATVDVDTSGANYQENDMAVDSSGNIVVASTSIQNAGSSLVRLTPDGTPDASFGDSGVVRFTDSEVGSIEIDSTDQIYTLARDNATLSRLNTDGSLDLDFGNNGIAQPSATGSVRLLNGEGLSVSSSGKIAVATADGVAVFNSDGTPDSSFDGDGQLDIDSETSNFFIAVDLVFDSGDTLLVSFLGFDGVSEAGFDSLVGELQQINPDGTTNEAFAADGDTTFVDRVYTDLELSSDNTILAGGTDVLTATAIVSRIGIAPLVDIPSVIEEVDELQDIGEINNGQAQRLTSHLSEAEEYLALGQTDDAIQQLNQVIHHLEKDIAKGRISEADGLALIALTQQLIDSLS